MLQIALENKLRMILLSVSRRPIWINQATQANYNKVPKIPFNFCYCCKSLQAVHNNICRSICLQRAECSHLSTMDHVPVSTAVLHTPFPRPVLYHSSNTTASSFRAPATCQHPPPATCWHHSEQGTLYITVYQDFRQRKLA